MIDKHDGIQAEKPAPPWEQPGRFRLDREPHRGTLLTWLAYPSLLLCHFSVLIQGVYFWSALHGRVRLWDAFMGPQYRSICTFVLLLSAAGMPLGLTAWWLARSDLAMMRKGLMDPDGQKLTRKASLVGLVGLVVTGLLAAFCGTVLLVPS